MREYACWRCGEHYVVFWMDVIRWYELLGMAALLILVWEMLKASTPLPRLFSFALTLYPQWRRERYLKWLRRTDKGEYEIVSRLFWAEDLIADMKAGKALPPDLTIEQLRAERGRLIDALRLRRLTRIAVHTHRWLDGLEKSPK